MQTIFKNSWNVFCLSYFFLHFQEAQPLNHTNFLRGFYLGTQFFCGCSSCSWLGENNEINSAAKGPGKILLSKRSVLIWNLSFSISAGVIEVQKVCVCRKFLWFIKREKERRYCVDILFRNFEKSLFIIRIFTQKWKFL